MIEGMKYHCSESLGNKGIVSLLTCAVSHVGSREYEHVICCSVAWWLWMLGLHSLAEL